MHRLQEHPGNLISQRVPVVGSSLVDDRDDILDKDEAAEEVQQQVQQPLEESKTAIVDNNR